MPSAYDTGRRTKTLCGVSRPELLPSPDALVFANIRSLLETRGIRSVTKNEELEAAKYSYGAQWPAIWIVYDSQFDEALGVIRESLSAGEPVGGRGWKCPRYDEELEAQLTECWRCAASKPSSPHTGFARPYRPRHTPMARYSPVPPSRSPGK